MKILVTGANGYLGRGVVKQLLDDGFDVVATDFKSDHIDTRATIILGNIFDIDEPFAFFGKPDVLLHMAWKDGFVHGAISHIDDLPKHVHFLSKMIESGIGRIAVLGSMHEVGFYEGSIDENTPCNPESLYGISKNALRSVIRLECKKRNVPFQWLRGFYIVGNTSDGCSIFSKIIQASQKGEKTFPFTKGLNQFDFLDYDVFCNYTAKAIEQDEVCGVINICSGRPEQLSSRVCRFISDNSLDIQLEYGKFPDRPYDSKAIWGNDAKIRKIMKNEE